MNQQHIDRALAVGHDQSLKGLLDPCGFARGVRAFLEELEKGANFFESIFLGLVLRLVDRAIRDCEGRGPNATFTSGSHP